MHARSELIRRSFLPLLVFLAAVGLPAEPAVAAVRTVGTAVGCEFPNLPFALAFSDSGDVLQLQATTFNGVLAGENFNLVAKNLTLVGGYDGCTGTKLPGARSTLAGTAAADSVLEISGAGNTILLVDLVVTGGQPDADGGGGIEIRGDVEVQLLGTIVYGNSSTEGGGILVDGPEAVLRLLPKSEVSSNDATGNGGGILCRGTSAMRAQVHLAPPAVIVANDAGLDGAGIALEDCELSIDPLPTDPPGAIRISSNFSDRDGGGIWARNSEVEAISTASHPILVTNNRAGRVQHGFGGGLRLVNSFAVLDGVTLESNLAPEGGALALDVLATVVVRLSAPFPGRSAAVRFNRGGTGGAFVMDGGAVLLLERARVEGNLADIDGPIGWVGPDGYLLILGSEVIGNRRTEGTGAAGIVAAGAEMVDLRGSTFVGNAGLASLVEIDDGGLVAEGLIVHGNDGEPFSLIGSPLLWLNCGVYPPGASLPPGGTGLHFGDPGLADAAGGDLHLLAGSPAIDLCSIDLGLDLDIEGDPRPQDGGYDAGADEYGNLIFADGFESGGVGAWSASQQGLGTPPESVAGAGPPEPVGAQSSGGSRRLRSLR